MVEPAEVRAYELVHTCGYALLAVERGEGALRTVKYCDDNSLSETFGEWVQNCPGCVDALPTSPVGGGEKVGEDV